MSKGIVATVTVTQHNRSTSKGSSEFRNLRNLGTEMDYDAEMRFVEFARKHNRSILSGTPRETNKAYDNLIVALRELRQTSDKGVSFLLGHLQAEDLSVVLWSALYLLPFRESEAVAALERVALSGQRHTGFAAEMTLREWRAGRLKVD